MAVVQLVVVRHMASTQSLLVVASALIIFTLGALHLLLTYRGKSFCPRDSDLESQMKAVAPRISQETTMWRAGAGFHASHSIGAMLFGLVYGYLALEPTQLLFKSSFLLTLGFAYLTLVAILCRLYWLRVPFWGLVLATLLYAGALITNGT